MVNVSLLGIGADYDAWHSYAISILINHWRHDMIIESAPVIPAQENRRTTPLGALHYCVHEIRYVGLSLANKSGRMFAVSSVRNDPRNSWQASILYGCEEVCEVLNVV